MRFRLTTIPESWLRRAILVAAGALILVCAGIVVTVARDQFFSSSTSEAELQVGEMEQAVRDNPNDADLRVSLANAYLSEGRYDAAIEQYKEALKQNPSRVDAVFGAGLAYKQKGDAEQALAFLSNFVELNKDKPADERVEAAHYYLGELYLQKGDAQTAVKELQAALAIKPTDADAIFLLARAVEALGEYADAVDLYGLATTFVPDFVEAYQGMAQAADKAGDDHRATFGRAMAKLFSGDVGGGVKDLEGLVEETPDDGLAYWGLGYGYELQGKTEEAVAAYQKALAADPEQFMAEDALTRLTQ